MCEHTAGRCDGERAAVEQDPFRRAQRRHRLRHLQPFRSTEGGRFPRPCLGPFMVPEPSRCPSLSSLISNPFDLLKARMQANAGKAPPGMVATAAEIVREGGILGLWKGTSTTVRHTQTHTHAPTPS